MRRRAIIVGNPGESGAENYCTGVTHDLRNYPAFLKQPLGGAWEASEIDVMVRPSVADLRTALGQLKSVDYAMVVFAGHAYYSSTRKTTVLELRSGQEIDSNDLRVGAPRQTVIFDCCRKVAQELVLKRLVEAMDKKASVLNRSECRKYYDLQIERCSAAVAALWACTVGETAGDDASNGGYYSSGLLEGATEWAQKSQTDPVKEVEYWSIVRAHEAALGYVRQKAGGRQTPTMEKPRSEPYFPFAIIA